MPIKSVLEYIIGMWTHVYQIQFQAIGQKSTTLGGRPAAEVTFIGDFFKSNEKGMVKTLFFIFI